MMNLVNENIDVLDDISQEQQRVEDANSNWKGFVKEFMGELSLSRSSHENNNSRSDIKYNLKNGVFSLKDINNPVETGGFIKGIFGIENEKVFLIFEENDGNYKWTELKEINEEITIYNKKAEIEIDKFVVDCTFQNINHSREVYSNSTVKYPYIDDRSSVEKIQLWKSEYFNWFKEQADYKDVFDYFLIPKGDTLNNSYCFIGLKFNPVLKTEMPTLIFIDRNVEPNIPTAKELIFSNSSDWSTPCPPYYED